MRKVIREGKVAILYSPGYGAGWYSWNREVSECISGRDIIDMVEAGRREDITDEYCEKLFGKYFYAGGADKLKIEWLPEGTQFIIDEYDGAESIKTEDDRILIA